MKGKLRHVWSLLLPAILFVVGRCGAVGDWDLPILPENFDEVWESGKEYQPGDHKPSWFEKWFGAPIVVGKEIPRILWIAIKKMPSQYDMPTYLQRRINQAEMSGWKVHLMDDAAVDNFMHSMFSNTSTHWSFGMIHQGARVAAIDIWRYAALYAFGGVYMDDDAEMMTALEQVVHSDDSLILGIEGNDYTNECYLPSYRLSDEHIQQSHNSTAFLSFFNGKFLINWAMFARPRHPLFLHVLHNIVEVIKNEYLGKSVLKTADAGRSRAVICATGPGILTATARSMVLKHHNLHGPTLNYPLRLAGKDFEEYGGRFKSKEFNRLKARQKNYTYYREYMQIHEIPLLASHHSDLR